MKTPNSFRGWAVVTLLIAVFLAIVSWLGVTLAG